MDIVGCSRVTLRLTPDHHILVVENAVGWFPFACGLW